MKTVIRQIQVWETTDGELFKNQNKAYEHQTSLEFEEAIIPFVEKHFSEFNGADQNMIASVLTNRAREIVEAYEQTRCL